MFNNYDILTNEANNNKKISGPWSSLGATKSHLLSLQWTFLKEQSAQ